MPDRREIMLFSNKMIGCSFFLSFHFNKIVIENSTMRSVVSNIKINMKKNQDASSWCAIKRWRKKKTHFFTYLKAKNRKLFYLSASFLCNFYYSTRFNIHKVIIIDIKERKKSSFLLINIQSINASPSFYESDFIGLTDHADGDDGACCLCWYWWCLLLSLQSMFQQKQNITM